MRLAANRAAHCLLHTGFFLDLLFNPADRDASEKSFDLGIYMLVV
jgi:hypothetical protein